MVSTSGSCPGDSGGLLMRNEWMPDLNDYRNIQTAVVHGAAQRCNGGRYPPIFVRIDTELTLSWINSIVFRQQIAAGTSHGSGSYTMISVLFFNGYLLNFQSFIRAIHYLLVSS